MKPIKKMLCAAVAVVMLTGSAVSAAAVPVRDSGYACTRASCGITAVHNHQHMNTAKAETKSYVRGISAYTVCPAENCSQAVWHHHDDAVDTVAYTAPADTAQSFVCEAYGCGRSDEHYHSICGLSSCYDTTNHEHDGILYYGHHEGDGHGHHNNTGYEGGGYQGGGGHQGGGYQGGGYQGGGGHQGGGGRHGGGGCRR